MGRQKHHSPDRYYRINFFVITSDIILIVQFPIICDTYNQTKTEAGSSAIPSHQADWNVVDAQIQISGSVNYGHEAVSNKSRENRSRLCFKYGGQA